MRAPHHSTLARTLAAALAVSIASPGCALPPGQAPSAGVPEYQREALIPVPGGFVNAAGGNLIVERLDLSIDTILGTQEIRAVYNAESGAWLWSFQVAYDGALFLDPTGAVHDVSALAGGEAIPGSVWVVVDGDTIRTKGGLAFHFDAGGRLDHVSWTTSDHPRIQYTWTAAGVEMASCATAAACLPFFAIALDAKDDPTSITDLRTGRTAEFEYDALGRLVVARDAEAVAGGGAGWRYEYSLGGTLLTAATNPSDVRVEYAYQADRRIRSVTSIGDGDPTHAFSFHALGGGRFVTIHGNPLGGLTRYVVDDERRLLEIERGAERTTLDWQGLRPSSRTLPNGASTLFTWTGDDLATLTQPSGNVVVVLYQPGALNLLDPFASAIAQLEDSLGPLEQRSYDAFGRLASVSNAAGETLQLAYNAGWGVASLVDAAGSLRSFPVHGIHGHWLSMEGDASDERQFDAVGNPLVPSLARQPGGALARTYDARRRLVSLGVAATLEDGGLGSEEAIEIERRDDGRVVAVRRPGGGDHELDYDALGRPVAQRERVDGVWRTTTFAWDDAGNLTARERPNGMREEFDYDRFGRLVAQRALRDGVLEAEAAYGWRDGQLESAWDSVRGATEVYAYDAAGRLETSVFGFGETETRAYDARSRLVRETLRLPGGEVAFDVGYAYDLADRRIHIGDWVTGATLLERDFAGGRLIETRYGNGLTRSTSYAPDGSLTGFATQDAGGQTLETTTIATTAELAPPRIQVRALTTTPLASSEEQYWLPPGASFASPELMVGKRVFGWSDGAGGARVFAYDELANRASDAQGDVFTYNAERNRLLAATVAGEAAGLSYGYDEAGFVTWRGGESLTWTAAGRLATFGASSAVWDLRGRPVALYFPGVEAEFHFGGRVPIDPPSGALGSLDLGEVVVAPAGGAVRYRHLDFRGHVGFVSDVSGQVVDQYRYSPYGLDAAFGSASDPVDFDGGLALGPFVLLGARVYDSAVGRFLSPDPLVQLANQYAYTSGNPLAFTDASGLFEMTRAQRNAILASIGLASAVVAALPVAGTILIAGVSLAVIAQAVTFTVATALALDNLVQSFELAEPSKSPSGTGLRPAPPAPGLGPGRAAGGRQLKVLELSYGAPPPQSTCSPTLLGTIPDPIRALPLLLLVNGVAAAAWLALWTGRWRTRRPSNAEERRR